jgi:hypothetical protein
MSRKDERPCVKFVSMPSESGLASGTLVPLSPRRNAAFIPMDESQGFQWRKPVRCVERRITPVSRNGVCGVTQADRADPQRWERYQEHL